MITKEQIEKLIDSTTKELQAIGYNPKRVYFSRFFKARSRYAQVWYNTGALDFSEYYREAPFEQIEATIMHEMCHMVPGVKGGHGKEWKEVAAKVSKAYPHKYNIKRVGSNSVKYPVDWSLRHPHLNKRITDLT